VSPSRSPDVDASSTPARASAVHTVELDGEAVLLDEDANRLHHLNPSAALLWACFDGETSVAALAAEISDALGVDHQDVLGSTLEVVRHMAAEGLLAGIPRSEDSGTSSSELGSDAGGSGDES
jgi:hypothetical protein